MARARAGSACRKFGINDYRNCDEAYYKAYVMDRPKGMHKKTFERLRRAVFEAADEEDAIEKLPVTPGPIVPAREQLGDLLLEQNHPDLAYKEFERVLMSAPGRRGALSGKAQSAERMRSVNSPG